MAWTAPRTWAYNELVSETIMNTHVRDNLLNAHYEYGTTLPAAPSDGQLAILVDSTSAPTYRWTFRFNNSIATYKWEFIGGTKFGSTIGNIQFANVMSYASTNSPAAIAAPRAGIYDVIVAGTTQRCTGNIGYWSYGVNGGIGSDVTASQSSSVYDGALWMVQRATLAANDTVRISYRASNSGTNHYLDNAQLSLLPVQVA